MILDTSAVRFNFHPFPGIFSYYANPIYRFMEYILGFMGAIFLSRIKFSLSYIESSILEILILSAYLFCCVSFDKNWIHAQFTLITILLIYAFTIRNGIFDQIFGNKIIIHLGDISMELFMIHQVVIRLLANKFKMSYSMEGFTLLLVLFLVSLIVAEFFHCRSVRNFITKDVWNYLPLKHMNCNSKS